MIRTKSFIMNIGKAYLLFFVFLCSVTLSAQNRIADSTYTLKEIKIISNRLDNYSSGTKVQVIDSNITAQYNNNSLATLLLNESSIFIKSYGAGSLATTSFRGGNATHTAVLWNGFNLNSPSNGQLDLSIIPNTISNKVSIQFGGSSALWGSGAVGGTILLNNNVWFNEGLTIVASLSAGSFDDYSQYIYVQQSKAKFVSSLKLFNHSSLNNFSYYNTAISDTSLVSQHHAAYKQNGIISENFLRINKYQKLNLCFWYQHNYREIPPTMLQLFNNSDEKDDNLRLTFEWQRAKEKLIWMNRIAYFDEHLNYSDNSYNYQALSGSKSIIAETESRWILNKMNFLDIGLNNTYVQAFSDGFQNKPIQNRTALFALYKFISKKNIIQSTIAVRQEIIKSKFVPFTFSIGSDVFIAKWVSTKVNFSKVYRIPTFNDLYWVPGGNADLLPKSGYCEEAGLSINLTSKKNNLGFVFEPTLFNRVMNHWIIWLPGQSYWSPQNLMKVHSRGMETMSELKIPLGNLSFKFALITNYVLSTNEKPKTPNDASVNKQLIYVPMYSGFAKFSLVFKGYSFNYQHGYTGYRYTSTDNTEYLEPYLIANIYLSKKMNIRKSEMNIYFQVNNIYNENYQILLYRAMPLRNFQVGFSIKFNKPN